MLNETQIEQLFAFCEKKRVRYYDIQVELVDHLANAIEEKMTTDPTKSFDKALDEVYSSFGIFGFAKVVQEKEAATVKQQRKLFYSILKDRLSWPKILLLITMLGIFYFLFEQFTETIPFTLAGIIIISTSIYFFETIRRNRKKLKKKILLNDYRFIYTTTSNPIVSTFIYYNASVYFNENIISFFSSFPTIPAFVGSALILELIIRLELQKKIDEEIEKKFPGIFVS